MRGHAMAGKVERARRMRPRDEVVTPWINLRATRVPNPSGGTLPGCGLTSSSRPIQKGATDV
ncbi:hypothetical protein GCM10010345_19950 [Streptomyces canarius]|uniref:Uncharacterized protein n=1 Tax=Streptomyces canarius TaxID=285453 RepID=A0ABQ3CIH7_9ACTN|nr:hypothetical protein GCM10010345_19950 [Streptomyces canarius]